MQARDVMTTQVVSVAPDTPVPEIARRLVENRISAVTVESQGRLVGIVSEGDLMRRPESGTDRRATWWLSILSVGEEQAAEFVKSHGRLAQDVMTRQVLTVAEDTPLEAVATLLERHRIKRVPVVREGGVVGIVSRANLLHGLAAAKPAPEPSADDRTLRTRVLDVAKGCGANLVYVNAVVSGAVVQLWGGVESEVQKKAIRVAAESVPGVKAVEDHLWVIPERVRGALGAQ